MLGTSSAQDAHILCLDFCTVAATHQDIRPKLLNFSFRHSIWHALSFAWRIIYTRKGVMLHTHTTYIAHNMLRELFIVRNCVGQQGS